jgi:hypothetical protein
MITMVYGYNAMAVGCIILRKRTNKLSIIIKGRSGIINELVLSVKSGTFIVVESVD